MKFSPLTFLTVFALLVPGVFCSAGESSTKLNMLVILADDPGFSDLGCFGAATR
jgi:hypothetical protein